MTVRTIHTAASWNVLEGIQRQVLAFGDQSLLARHRLAANAVIPRHSHPEEQITFILTGKVEVHCGPEGEDVSEDVFVVSAGGCWVVPANQSHEITALEASEALDFFAPPRSDYVEEFKQHETERSSSEV